MVSYEFFQVCNLSYTLVNDERGKNRSRDHEIFLVESCRMNGERESANGSQQRISNGTRPAGAQEVTQLLTDWGHGDQTALQKLTPLVYEELRCRAHRYMEG